MDNTKHGALSLLSSMPAWLTALDSQTMLTIISSILLPVIFFALSKYIDYRLMYARKRDVERDRTRDRGRDLDRDADRDAARDIEHDKLTDDK